MALSKLIPLLLFVLAQTCASLAWAQRPDQLPQDITASGSDEIYMQNPNEGSSIPTPRRQNFETARTYFGAAVQTLTAVPTSTGNVLRNVVGTAPDGQVYFIDYLGRSLRLGGAGSYLEQTITNHTGSTVTLTALVSNVSKLLVYRSGILLRAFAGDFTVTGNQLTFAVPSTGDHLIIQTPL